MVEGVPPGSTSCPLSSGAIEPSDQRRDPTTSCGWITIMPRNKSFHPSHEPFREHHSLHLHESHIDGPFSFLNPTGAYFRSTAIPSKKTTNTTASDEEKAEPTKDEQLDSGVQFRWRSRDNRKGRHALVIQPSATKSEKYIEPEATHSLRGLRKGLIRMVIQYPYWDISWLVATVFTLGSVVWVINAFFAYLPLAQPGTEFENEIPYGGGITAFIGATIFEIGSVLLMFEAVNENRSGCFGWALERLVEDKDSRGEGTIRIRPDLEQCAHHHTNRKNLVGKSDCKSPLTSSRLHAVQSILKPPEVHPPSTSGSDNSTSTVSLNAFIASQNPSEIPASSPSSNRSWIWFPSLHELRT